jgi:pimeloyl-ACP methyl ester carboxylesterase
MRDKPVLVAEWQEIFASVDVKSTLFGLGAVTGRDSIVSRLPEIRVPSLVAVGQEDQSLEPSRSKHIHEGLADSDCVEIRGAGHLSALEQPEAVNDVIARFLQRVSSAASATGG